MINDRAENQQTIDTVKLEQHVINNEDDVPDSKENANLEVEPIYISKYQGKKSTKTRKTITLSICEVAILTTLLIISAFIKIPLPPIPFSLQTMVCLIGGGLFGKFKALSATLLYIFLGLVGLPIFTSGGGFTYIFHPTFGYLIAMIFSSFLVGLLTEKFNGYVKTGIICFTTLIIMLFVGTLYMYMIFNVHLGNSTSFGQVLISGFALFIFPELLKSALATILIVKVKPIINKMI